jgi:uncharacterized protein
MSGELVYFVVPARDAERAKAFYGELFGWGFATGNVPGGFHIQGSTPPGGLSGGGEGSSPSVYFSVDDIDAAVARIRELGGRAGDPEEIESGYMSSCEDDQGTSFNIWAPRAEG